MCLFFNLILQVKKTNHSALFKWTAMWLVLQLKGITWI
jgi:hypothetical protein